MKDRALLFDRTSKRLELNPRGHQLLIAVRDAMRGVDDGLSQVVAQDISEIRIATTETLAATHVLPALARCIAGKPALRVQLEPVQGELGAQLLRGEIDLACTSRSVAHSALRIARLPDLASSVYCGTTHALRRRRAVTLADLRPHGFAAPPPRADGSPIDGWPVELERTVVTVTYSLHQGIELCRLGGVLGVFPDLLSHGLHRLPIDIAEPAAVYVITRRSLRRAGIVESLVRDIARARAHNGPR